MLQSCNTHFSSLRISSTPLCYISITPFLIQNILNTVTVPHPYNTIACPSEYPQHRYNATPLLTPLLVLQNILNTVTQPKDVLNTVTMLQPPPPPMYDTYVLLRCVVEASDTAAHASTCRHSKECDSHIRAAGSSLRVHRLKPDTKYVSVHQSICVVRIASRAGRSCRMGSTNCGGNTTTVLGSLGSLTPVRGRVANMQHNICSFVRQCNTFTS
jgi:hypothetical protein